MSVARRTNYITRVSEENFHALCTAVAGSDDDLKRILVEHGFPPFWVRPNSFETLVLTILEQQVSLASAFAAYKKLKERIGDITPFTLLQLSDDELRSCYFSRQKVVYVRGLANAIHSGSVDLDELYHLDEEDVRIRLKALKGIGDWTVDIYLIHALRHPDVLPLGDLALVQAIKWIKSIDGPATKQDLIAVAGSWKPYRSLATMILWHYYICKKKIRLEH